MDTLASVEAVRWTAAVTGIIAAVMIAVRFGGRVTGWGFVVFTVSSVAWILTGWLDDTWSLLAQNLVLFVINLLGVWRWLIRHEGG